MNPTPALPQDPGDGTALPAVALLRAQLCRSAPTDMQTASVPGGAQSPAAVKDGGGEAEIREVTEVPGQPETMGMELQQAEGVIGPSTASGT